MKYVKMLATKQNKLNIHTLLLIITFFIKKEKYILKKSFVLVWLERGVI